MESGDSRSDQSSDQEQVYILQGPSESDELVPSSERRLVYRSKNMRLPKTVLMVLTGEALLANSKLVQEEYNGQILTKLKLFTMCLRKEAYMVHVFPVTCVCK